MSLTVSMLSFPLPVIAGIFTGAAGAAGETEIARNIGRRLARRWNTKKTGDTETGIRSKVKKRNFLSQLRAYQYTNIVKISPSLNEIQRFFALPRFLMERAIPGHEVQGGDVFEPEKFNYEVREIAQVEKRRKNLTQDAQNLRPHIVLDPDMEKVFEFCRVKNDVKFLDAISYWKQMTARKIAEGSYGEIYDFSHIDGSKRIFKCIPINGQHPMSSYQNISLTMAVPDIVASKLLSDLRDGSNCAAPNFPTIYNISLVRDRFPEPLMRGWWDYKYSPKRLKDPGEHPQPDQYPESQLYLTMESSYCGVPLTSELLQNAWMGVSIMSQIVSALAVAEAAYDFEHRDLHLANILVQSTSAESLKYSIHNQHFTINPLGYHAFIIDFTLSRIYYDKRVYCLNLDDIAKCSEDREDSNESMWQNHNVMYEIMGELSNGKWDSYAPATNIIWLKYMNENILNCVKKNNPLFSNENEDQLKAFRLLMEWNGRILKYMSATDLLYGVISKNNPIISVHK